MYSKVNEYAYAYAIFKLKAPTVPDGFALEHEIEALLEANITNAITDLNVDRMAEPKELAKRAFDELLNNGVFEIEDGDIVGPYLKFVPDKYKTFRQALCQHNDIIARSRKIGERYFPEVFATLERQLVDGDLEAFTTPASERSGAELKNAAEADVIPASDRLVALAHNQPEYVEIASRLDDAIDEVLSLKSNEISNDEKASAVASLRSAAELWKAYELKAMQVRIGVLMAIEEAQQLTKLTFKLTGGGLLTDAIRLLIRHTTGLNL